MVKRRKVSGVLFSVAFLWAGIGMGMDIKSGLIAKDFGSFAQAKLNSMFSGKEVRLARIESSGFKNLAITDFKVSKKPEAGGEPTPILSVDKIIIDYSLLNLALRRFENLGRIYLVSPSLFFNPRQEAGFNLPPSASSYFANTSTYAGRPLKFQILNGNIAVLGKAPILKNLEGQVVFYETGLKLNRVKCSFLNIPVVASGRVENIFDRPSIRLRLTAQDKNYTMSFTFKGAAGKGEGYIWGRIRIFDRFESRFKGVVNIEGGQTVEIKRLVLTHPFDPASGFSVTGEIDPAKRSSSLIIKPRRASSTETSDSLQPGYIKAISGVAADGKMMAIRAKVHHLNILGHDVLCEVNVNTGLYTIPESREVLKGSIKTQALIVDYRPFKEIELSWLLKNKELFITNFELGDRYRLSGRTRLSRPYPTDLSLSINNAELSDLFVFLGPSYSIPVSGVVSGEVRIAGPADALVTDGRINIREGNISDIRFNAINFNLRGKGPILVISDSRIFKDGGFLCMDGEIDIRKFGKRNILEDIKITTDQKVIVWEGWDITKSPSEITAKKGVTDEVDINFKTYVTAGTRDGFIGDDRKSEIGLDYKIKKDDSINVRMKDDSAFVGVEHKMRF